jgi:ABC-2 type transport system permease protein
MSDPSAADRGHTPQSTSPATSPPPPLSSESPRPPTPGAFLTLYRLMLSTQVTRARVISLVALGVVAVLVGFAIGQADVFDPIRDGTRFVNGLGLSVVVPVATLVFASASLGELNEDSTLVYLWLRPVARWKIVGAAALASFTVTWPLVTIPLMIAASLTGAGGTLVVATVAGVTVSMVGYVGLFVALGLRVKRALPWGLLYILIWEGFVANGNATAARLAVRSYGRSTLSSITGVSLRLAEISAPWRWVVPLGVAFVALAYATRRLSRQDVA